MLKEFTPEGTLQYPEFLKITLKILPLHMLRSFGGALYLSGFLVLIYNIVKTIAQGKLVANQSAEALSIGKIIKPYASEFWHAILERETYYFHRFSCVNDCGWWCS
jgi:cytochrome c oxidase cbb3-type subunit I/II